MTKEQAERYTAIQGRRGEWLRGDKIYVGGFTWIVHSRRQEDFIECFCLEMDEIHEFKINDPDLIWIPPAIDDERPERGLLGILGDYFYNITKMPNGWVFQPSKGTRLFFGSTPADALLAAIIRRVEC